MGMEEAAVRRGVGRGGGAAPPPRRTQVCSSYHPHRHMSVTAVCVIFFFEGRKLSSYLNDY
jgi:hypothetical protein